ncbi:sigma E protease regulator RseP [Spongiibacter tropicus]|uniref:sigma E protease regulator RseP n=1 Tax=Spongiibacter tropicus TaxID=454602 RepID=UPI0035BE456E
MLEILQTILITIVTLGVLVSIHEFGHFWVARRCGVKVLRFSVGFGKPLLSWRDKSGTEYAVAGIPLGGYVKMLDEREGDVPEDIAHMAFNRATPARRIAIAAAGPLANFALAIVAYWAIFMNGVGGVAPIVGDVMPGSLAERAGLESGQEIVAVDGEETPTWESLQMQLLERIGETGNLTLSVKWPDSDLTYQNTVAIDRWMQGLEEPNPLSELGVTLYMPEFLPIVGEVVDGSAAARAGLKPGDRIVSVDGKRIEDWQGWVQIARASPSIKLALSVERDGQPLAISLTPERKLEDNGVAVGFVGVAAEIPEWPEQMRREMHYGPVSAMTAALNKTWQMSVFTLESLKKMLTGLLSPKNLSGPITIAKVAGSSAQYGVFSWLNFLGLLSISLAVLNLLPIPILDGGHIVYATLEWLRGKPVTEQVQALANQVGLALVVGVMFFALYNDVLRL